MQVHRLSYSSCVCLLVCHTLLPYQNNTSYGHEMFTVSSVKDPVARICIGFYRNSNGVSLIAALNLTRVGKICDF